MQIGNTTKRGNWSFLHIGILIALRSFITEDAVWTLANLNCGQEGRHFLVSTEEWQTDSSKKEDMRLLLIHITDTNTVVQASTCNLHFHLSAASKDNKDSGVSIV